MAEFLQISLLILLIIIGVIFIFLCVQLFFLIKDIRKTLVKANRVLENTEDITGNISEPISALSGLAETLSTGAILGKIIKVAVKMVATNDTKKSKKGDDDDE